MKCFLCDQQDTHKQWCNQQSTSIASSFKIIDDAQRTTVKVIKAFYRKRDMVERITEQEEIAVPEKERQTILTEFC
jgi:hypothetical protein